MKVTIILKTGHAIEVTVKTSIEQFIQCVIKGINPSVDQNIYVEGAVMLNFGQIAAIVPSGWVKQSRILTQEVAP